MQQLGSRAKNADMDFSALDYLGIQRLATDSRRVRRGDTFVAYPFSDIEVARKALRRRAA